jgi:hypothetical protein
MKAIVVLASALLAGCAMTPTQKKVASFVGGVLIVGAIAAHDADNGKPEPGLSVQNPSGPPCTVQPDGSCR